MKVILAVFFLVQYKWILKCKPFPNEIADEMLQLKKGNCPTGQSRHDYIQEQKPHGFAGRCRRQDWLLWLIIYILLTK